MGSEIAVVESRDEEIRRFSRELEVRRKQYGLDDREMKFVMVYVTNFCPETAYMSVWWVDDPTQSKAKALELISQPRIRHAVASEVQAQGEMLFLKREMLIGLAWNEAVNMKAKPAERLKAIETLAKLSGIMDQQEKTGREPKLHLTINDPGKILLRQTETQTTREMEINLPGNEG